MLEIKPSKTEIEDTLHEALDCVVISAKFPGLSYEEGVVATINWILGLSDENPMDTMLTSSPG